MENIGIDFLSKEKADKLIKIFKSSGHSQDYIARYLHKVAKCKFKTACNLRITIDKNKFEREWGLILVNHAAKSISIDLASRLLMELV